MSEDLSKQSVAFASLMARLESTQAEIESLRRREPSEIMAIQSIRQIIGDPLGKLRLSDVVERVRNIKDKHDLLLQTVDTLASDVVNKDLDHG